MPWLVNDVIFVEAKQEYLEQSLVNTLFYKIIDIVGTAITNALLELLAETIIDFITPAQNTSLDHIEQVMSNLTDGISQHVSVYNVSGDRPPTLIAASFFAAGMKKSVSSRITRPGSIRIAGLVEADLSENDLVGTYVNICNAVGNDLAGTIVIDDGQGSIASFNPVIVGRDEVGAFDLARVNDITNVGQPRLTTQNSRKPER